MEILLVVGIISILAGIVIVAINPSKQLASVRNAQRKSDIKQIDSALTQYYIDEFEYPADITSSWKEICDTGSAQSTTTAEDGTDCSDAGLANLSALVPTYITAIPKDPSGDAISFLDKITTKVFAATGGNGYKVIKDASSGKLGLSATNAELSQTIVLGVSTSTGGGGDTGCVATGGTIDTESAPGYKIHTFTDVGSDTFTVTSDSCEVEVLVVAGGGGGGKDNGGGGGGGGVISTTTTVVTSEVTVTVGDGGAGVTNSALRGTNGDTSSFGEMFVSLGGGGGGSGGNKNGNSGASGGGAANGGTGGSSSDNTQGHSGGNGGSPPNGVLGWPGGGGGGAGAVGVGAVDYGPAGNGGDGFSSSISGASVYYAGGGGGARSSGTAGTGGLGGGGNGGSGGIGTSGTLNTGGGGGASTSAGSGGKGGSGIVIVRYAVSD